VEHRARGRTEHRRAAIASVGRETRQAGRLAPGGRDDRGTDIVAPGDVPAPRRVAASQPVQVGMADAVSRAPDTTSMRWISAPSAWAAQTATGRARSANGGPSTGTTTRPMSTGSTGPPSVRSAGTTCSLVLGLKGRPRRRTLDVGTRPPGRPAPSPRLQVVDRRRPFKASLAVVGRWACRHGHRPGPTTTGARPSFGGNRQPWSHRGPTNAGESRAKRVNSSQHCSPLTRTNSQVIAHIQRCPRRDSNPRTRLRRPMLYPLSYEGRRGQGSAHPRSRRTRGTS
jgi:hypothetical protein